MKEIDMVLAGTAMSCINYGTSLYRSYRSNSYSSFSGFTLHINATNRCFILKTNAVVHSFKMSLGMMYDNNRRNVGK